MIDRKIDTHDLTGRRRGWKPIAVRVGEGSQYGPGLLAAARQRRWQLIDLTKFIGRVPDGIPLRGAIVTEFASDPSVREMLDRGIPVVRIGRWPHPDDSLVPAVMPDRAAAGRLATDHFAERDFRHIAFVGRAPWGDNEKIYAASAARAKELGCTCHLLRFSGTGGYPCEPGEKQQDARWRVRREEFAHWLKALPKPVGLLAFTDRDADRYAYWASKAGLRVPEDIAVMGMSNDEFICESAPVPISSIAFNIEAVSETATHTLAQLMDGHKLKQTAVMVAPLGVATRQSTDVLAASDPRVVKALRFMWDHITEDLSVDQIAEQTGVPYRTLQRVFQRDLGRGIGAEFHRRRIEKSRELLLQSDVAIGALADTMGFASHRHFFRAFRAAYGMSPLQYRRHHGVTRQ